MIATVEIENLRGIVKGALDDLAPLTILVGPNNSGKSTVLEALWFGASQGDAGIAAQLAIRRGWCGIGCVGQVQYRPSQPTVVRIGTESRVTDSEFDIGAGVDVDFQSAYRDDRRFALGQCQVNARCRDSTSRVLIGWNGDVSPSNWLTGAFPQQRSAFVDVSAITRFNTLEDAYSAAAALGYERDLESLLARIGLKDQTLRILKGGDWYVLHQVADGRALPAYFLGDGYKRLLLLACQLASAKSLVLIEEPECFQHPRYLDELAGLLWAAQTRGTQVVLSTHSLDLLRRMFAVDGTPLDQAAVFQTRLMGGALTSLRIPGPRAAERLEHLDEDLRR
jgi:energy-coupling factor transporter ATP-binding protein EcfA2